MPKDFCLVILEIPELKHQDIIWDKLNLKISCLKKSNQFIDLGILLDPDDPKSPMHPMTTTRGSVSLWVVWVLLWALCLSCLPPTFRYQLRFLCSSIIYTPVI